MRVTAGIDVGSRFTKAVLVDEHGNIIAREMLQTGFKLKEISKRAYHNCLSAAKLTDEDIQYIVATGAGRHQVDFKDIHATDFTAGARGASLLFPDTRTVLDVGGQTMKASRVDDVAKVLSFRLNDKCAAGTGAFIEKTAKYMGFSPEEIGPLLKTSKEPVTVSSVCAVFAESEVINHLSLGAPPADILYGSIISLVQRSMQLLRRVKAKPEYTLIGGILRFQTMSDALREELKSGVNIPADDMPQFVTAFGAAVLGHRRLEKLSGSAATAAKQVAC